MLLLFESERSTYLPIVPYGFHPRARHPTEKRNKKYNRSCTRRRQGDLHRWCIFVVFYYYFVLFLLYQRIQYGLVVVILFFVFVVIIIIIICIFFSFHFCFVISSPRLFVCFTPDPAVYCYCYCYAPPQCPKLRHRTYPPRPSAPRRSLSNGSLRSPTGATAR